MSGPLEGVRVFDLTLLLVGPWASNLLGALGADVIHIEQPGVADETRSAGVPPLLDGMSTNYIAWNMNKRQLFLDLKSETDRDVAKRLIAECDVFLENMRPGVADRLGLSYEVLRDVNPRLIYCSISGWGRSGPMASTIAADGQVQAFTGLASVNGAPGGRPEIYPQMTMIDASTGMYAVSGILMALMARERTEQGQRVDLSMLEAATALQTTRLAEFIATGEPPHPMGSACPGVVPSEAFACADGVFVAVHAETLDHWRSLCGVTGLEGLADDERYATIAGRVAAREEITAALGTAFRSKPARWWTLQLAAARVPCSRAMHFEELIHHPQVIANGYIQEVVTDAWGGLYVGGPPWQFSRTPARLLPTARPGEHTSAILEELDGAATR